MERYSLQEAQTQLDKLLADARNGKTVVILDDDNRPVKLMPIEEDNSNPRKAGRLKGKIHMSDDFDAPLEDFREYME
jgi:antitoxin (DNA-binding transcriptional repressor) of toxin-antitoxin stability system